MYVCVWTVVRPRPTQATSIPALVALFQNEWDALMVETYTLKQHLSHTRKVRHT
jgi:pre-mRNA-processing factor 19